MYFLYSYLKQRPLQEKILIELHYLGNIQYFANLSRYPFVIIEQHENYSKGSYRNRTIIAGSLGPLRLSIPLAKGKNERLPIKEVLVSNTDNWQTQHWRSIQTAYGKSPFFEFYQDELKTFYEKPVDHLFEWNKSLLLWMVETLGLSTSILFSTAYQKTVDDSILDARNRVSPKTNRAGQSNNFSCPPYAQVFEDLTGFLPNLSILDLLFCKGPESILYLEACAY